ncbi:hypothetical protein Sjap_017433 [Stephania japonica]|uniref:O-methyltransferase n=1 Tax=Stephania japonica TaxID=461633 RepID=A0AAP0NJF3_9MAGN|nr:COMT protein [Stephania japonica]
MEEIGNRREPTVSKNDCGDEEQRAEIDMWRYIFGFSEMAVLKCAIELGIAEAMEAHGQAGISLSELATALNCSSSYLYRIIRFLIHLKFLKEKCSDATNGAKLYTLTPLGCLLMKQGERGMAPLVLLENSPVMLAPWQALSGRVRNNDRPPFEAAHGEDIWGFAAENLNYSKLINEAMACDARIVVPAIVNGCTDVFDGVESVVDVGGGDGTTLGMLVKAFPWIKGINFDLPHVVSVAPERNGVEHIGGDMFKAVPQADATFLMWVLHDWCDEECIEILRKCREAIPKDKGKVIIVDAVIEEADDEQEKEQGDYNYKLKGAILMLDMGMMAHTNRGKERTGEEWRYVLDKAGFSRFVVRPIRAVQSVIVAYY